MQLGIEGWASGWVTISYFITQLSETQKKNYVGPLVNKVLTDSDKWKLKTEQIVVGPFYVSQVCSLFPDQNNQQCGPDLVEGLST